MSGEEGVRLNAARCLRRTLSNLIGRGLARPAFQGFGQILLELSIRILGFEHSDSLRISGEAKFLEKVLRGQEGLVIDVGAFRGEWTRLALRNPKIQALAIEPLSAEHHELMDLGHEYPRRLQILTCAAGEVDSTASLFRPSGTGVLASLHSDVSRLGYVNAEKMTVLPVTVRSLDSLWDEHFGWENPVQIKFLKIDVEGHECAVIRGASELISRYAPDYISVEANTHHIYTECSIFQISQQLPGYQLIQLMPFDNGTVRRNSAGSVTNVHRFANFVFVADHVKTPFGM